MARLGNGTGVEKKREPEPYSLSGVRLLLSFNILYYLLLLVKAARRVVRFFVGEMDILMSLASSTRRQFFRRTLFILGKIPIRF